MAAKKTYTILILHGDDGAINPRNGERLTRGDVVELTSAYNYKFGVGFNTNHFVYSIGGLFFSLNRDNYQIIRCNEFGGRHTIDVSFFKRIVFGNMVGVFVKSVIHND